VRYAFKKEQTRRVCVYGYQHYFHKLTIPRTLPSAWTVQFFSRPGRSFFKAHLPLFTRYSIVPSWGNHKILWSMYIKIIGKRQDSNLRTVPRCFCFHPATQHCGAPDKWPVRLHLTPSLSLESLPVACVYPLASLALVIFSSDSFYACPQTDSRVDNFGKSQAWFLNTLLDFWDTWSDIWSYSPFFHISGLRSCRVTT
jgi:hypothetical protein